MRYQLYLVFMCSAAMEYTCAMHENQNHQFTTVTSPKTKKLQKQNCKLLFKAAQQGCVVLVNKMLRLGTPINNKDSEGNTPLHYATIRNHLDVVLHLLYAKAATDAQNNKREIPLHYSAKSGNATIALLLLNYGSPLEIKDIHESSPLEYAVNGGHISVIHLLLHTKPQGVNDNAKDALLSNAVLNKNRAVLDVLLKAGANPNVPDKQNLTPLHYATFGGHTELVKLLLSAQANPETLGSTSVTILFHLCNSKDILFLLLKQGITVPKQYLNKVKHILKLNSLGTCMLEQTADTQYAVLHNLESADLNSQDACGMTPLMWAVAQGHESIVKVLLKQSKNNSLALDTLNTHGETALTLANNLPSDTIAKALYNYLASSRVAILLYSNLPKVFMYLIAEYLYDAKLERCNHCAKQPVVQECDKCATPYCSPYCQLADWQNHKSKCVKRPFSWIPKNNTDL